MSNADVIQVAKCAQLLSRHVVALRRCRVALREKIEIDGNEAGRHSPILLIRTCSSGLLAQVLESKLLRARERIRKPVARNAKYGVSNWKIRINLLVWVPVAKTLRQR